MSLRANIEIKKLITRSFFISFIAKFSNKNHNYPSTELAWFLAAFRNEFSTLELALIVFSAVYSPI